MARSQETYNKKEVRFRKEKKRKEKEKKRLERRTVVKDGNTLDNMIAYVDENGRITSRKPDPGTRTKVKAEEIEISVPRRQSEGPVKNIRQGIITFYNESKGFGFIRDLENQKSVFVHVNDMEDMMGETSRVTFEVEQGVRGTKAVHVKLETKPPAGK